MERNQLIDVIRSKKSFLCVGLDSDIGKIPSFLKKYDDPVFEFNKQIFDATIDYTVAYKPNLAFYESRGTKGWQSLEKTIKYIRATKKHVFTIADAKRGDIGNTSTQYAKAFFEYFDFDAITVSPYMGEDSVRPFLQFEKKWVILLALTSNVGANDFQFFNNQSKGLKLFEQVLLKSQQWAGNDKLMYVVGATRPELFDTIRKHVPDHFLLVPGIGAQGGSLSEVSHHGMSADCCMLVNSSREIIFGSDKEDFAEVAALRAKKVQQEMSQLLSKTKFK